MAGPPRAAGGECEKLLLDLADVAKYTLVGSIFILLTDRTDVDQMLLPGMTCEQKTVMVHCRTYHQVHRLTWLTPRATTDFYHREACGYCDQVGLKSTPDLNPNPKRNGNRDLTLILILYTIHCSLPSSPTIARPVAAVPRRN